MKYTEAEIREIVANNPESIAIAIARDAMELYDAAIARAEVAEADNALLWQRLNDDCSVEYEVDGPLGITIGTTYCRYCKASTTDHESFCVLATTHPGQSLLDRLKVLERFYEEIGSINLIPRNDKAIHVAMVAAHHKATAELEKLTQEGGE